MTHDFTSVTELPGDDVTAEQVERLVHRYYWAGEYCRGKDVAEVACGAGQGLGYISSVARSLRAGDITPALVAQARAQYAGRIDIAELDAQNLPFADASLDVIILFEAIYYLPMPARFVDECLRVLKPEGTVLVVTANKDLYDFNASPFSQQYFGVVELADLFGTAGFQCEFFGITPVNRVSVRQRLLRPVKALAAKLNLIPKTMAGKKTLKRLVFGKLVTLPAEIKPDAARYVPPVKLSPRKPDHIFKAIYLVAKLPSMRAMTGHLS